MHPDLNGEQATPPRQWAGKYRDPEELEKGYQNLQDMANRNWQELQELKARMDTERMDPAERRESRRDPRAALEEVGVPTDALMELVRSGVEDALRPVVEAQNAREEVSKSYPDFVKFEQDVANWITSNPQLQSRYAKMFAADQAGAMEWAINAYSRETSRHEQPPENPYSTGEASLPPTGGSGPRGYDNSAASEDMAKEMERARATGDWNRYIAQRLSGTVPDKHYEGLRY
jgi:hypothetical protein